MCTSKVYIKDKYRPNHFGNYFPCGKCKACKQQAAARRSRRIRYHRLDGYTPYFITLSYDNQFIPYIKRHELIDYHYEYLKALKSDPNASYDLPIYRQKKVEWKGNKRVISFNEAPIAYHTIKTPYPFSSFSDLRGVCKILKNKERREIPYKISVAYSPDAQGFFKRLRSYMDYYFGKNKIALKYFYAPEYGPTTQRFHIHLLVWFPSWLSEYKVRFMCRKSWPYQTYYDDDNDVQIARDPSNYLASYVNCSNNVSDFLQKEFRLRPSHSLAFGFDNRFFGLEQVLNAWRNGQFKYPIVRSDKNGLLFEDTVYYPQYVINRYFPKIKGYSRLTRTKVRDIMSHPTKYIRCEAPTGHLTPSGIPLYYSPIIDRYGQSIAFTLDEARYLINRILNTYDRFYKPLGYSYAYYVNTVIDYNDSLSQYMYKESQTSLASNGIYEFYNLSDIHTDRIRNDTIFSLCDSLSDDSLDPNKFPQEIAMTVYYTDKFNSNIKQRKCFNLDKI